MEKLIELLNEYERSKGTNLEIKVWGCLYWSLSYLWYGNSYSNLLCISKSYYFIQRLVENDKIDRSKVLISFSMAEYDGLWNMYWHWVDRNQRLLMILAISDTPIEDLISYLR